MMRALHQIEVNILRKLLFSTKLRFNEIKICNIENSHVVFYLDKLVKGYIISKDAGYYSLTDLGKEYANRMDDESGYFRIQPKTTTVMCCTRDTQEGFEYLVYKRLKNPFYGRIGFPAHKVWWGEKLETAVLEGLNTETGLLATNAILLGIRHYHIYSESRSLLEDKIMYVYHIPNPEGTLSNNTEGEYFWIKEIEFDSIMSDQLPDFQDELNLLKIFDGIITFEQIDQITNTF